MNGHYKNVKFMCADVTSPDLKIEDGSVDLIFSNWLLMYLSDKEVISIISLCVLQKRRKSKCLRWDAGGTFGRKNAWMGEARRIHFLQRILLPSIWR